MVEQNIVPRIVEAYSHARTQIASVPTEMGYGYYPTMPVEVTVGGATITLTALAIAALAGVILNAILPGKDYTFGADAASDAHIVDVVGIGKHHEPVVAVHHRPHATLSVATVVAYS